MCFIYLNCKIVSKVLLHYRLILTLLYLNNQQNLPLAITLDSLILISALTIKIEG